MYLSSFNIPTNPDRLVLSPSKEKTGREAEELTSCITWSKWQCQDLNSALGGSKSSWTTNPHLNLVPESGWTLRILSWRAPFSSLPDRSWKASSCVGKEILWCRAPWPHCPPDSPTVGSTLRAQLAFLPERLLPECKWLQLMLPIGSLRERDVRQFIYYMIQEIYWRLEGSMENTLDLFSVEKVCLRDSIGYLILAFWFTADPESWRSLFLRRDILTSGYLLSKGLQCGKCHGHRPWCPPFQRSVAHGFSCLNLSLNFP